MKSLTSLAACLGLLLAVAAAQQNAPSQDMSGMPMSGQDAAQPRHASGMNDSGAPDAAAPAMQSMQEHHMDMGPHMRMTTLRAPQSGDQQKADTVVEAARRVADKYQDYRAALNDGYQIFLPKIPQKQYHFTNYRYGFESAFRFNPDHPTSLLYEKHGSAYKLIGVMYTAPKRFSENQLNQRIPLSIAQWHEHVNFCAPPSDRRREMLGPKAKFGLRGSISTREECEANGGTFHPVVFGWMVHLYPFSNDPAQIWSVERQMHHGGAE